MEYKTWPRCVRCHRPLHYQVTADGGHWWCSCEERPFLRLVTEEENVPDSVQNPGGNPDE